MMQIINKFYLAITSIVVAAPLLAAAVQKPYIADYSNRCSLTDVMSLGSFNTDTDGWQPISGETASISAGKGTEGVACLQLSSRGLQADRWKGIARIFSKPISLDGRSMLSFDILTPSVRPGSTDSVRVTLGSRHRRFVLKSAYMPSLWRTVIFDLSCCKFLKSVDRIEIAFMNQSEKPWDCDVLFDDIKVGFPIDFEFSARGCSHAFVASGGSMSEADDALVFRFSGKASVATCGLENSRNSMFNPDLNSYNTVQIVMANNSSATSARLYFRTDRGELGEFCEAQSKQFSIEPHSGLTSYMVNLSDIAGCHGHLQGLCLANEDATARGSWSIDRIRLLREEPITRYAGTIDSCTATESAVTITGSVDKQLVADYPWLEIYEAPLYLCGHVSSVEELGGVKKADAVLQDTEISRYTLLYRQQATEHFSISNIVNRSSYGNIPLISSRLLAVLRNDKGDFVKVAPYFFIENWHDFAPSPYEFTLPKRRLSVLDTGAKGDWFTDDTDAINRAITAISEAGGGTVVIPGGPDGSERRYVATNVVLKDNVELHLDKGAVLWQSGDVRDYKYMPFYGHDVDIPNVNWTHTMFVTRPLVEALGVNHIKLTGNGTLRMNDPYCQNPHWGHYARVCTDAIHILPFGAVNCDFVELSGVSIVRTCNYHVDFRNSSNISVGDIKLFDVNCVSTDGVGLAKGTHNVHINRMVLNGNDDGVTLSTSYNDPRGHICPWQIVDESNNHSIRNVTVVNSSICSTHGAGKAIAFIPWGSTNPRLEYQEIYDIEVTGCMLIGGYSVGTWPDNPFDGKPFTNAETDDYSPIKNVYIHNNVYADPCDLLCVRPTNFRGDTGIHSADFFQNPDFADGHCYWTLEGDADVADGEGYARNGGRLMEGLYLAEGNIVMEATVKGTGRLLLIDTDTRKVLAEVPFNTDDFATLHLKALIPATADYLLGVEGQDAKVKSCRLAK